MRLFYSDFQILLLMLERTIIPVYFGWGGAVVVKRGVQEERKTSHFSDTHNQWIGHGPHSQRSARSSIAVTASFFVIIIIPFGLLDFYMPLVKRTKGLIINPTITSSNEPSSWNRHARVLRLELEIWFILFFVYTILNFTRFFSAESGLSNEREIQNSENKKCTISEF